MTTPEEWAELGELKIMASGETGNEIPPYAARANTWQQLGPITPARHQRRTVGGTLKGLSQPQFRLFSLTVTGDDVRAPSHRLVWPDALVTVHAGALLNFRTGEESPIRPAVPGSLFEASDGFTYYRPILEMMVVDYETSRSPYQARQTWRLEMAEVGPAEEETS